MAQKRVRVKLGTFEVKVSGVEIDVIDDSADISQLKEIAATQVKGIFAPAAAAVPQIEASAPAARQTVEVPGAANESPRPRRGARPRATKGTTTDSAALTWRPDVKFGNPGQDWSTFQKGSWLLYCWQKDHPQETKGLSLKVITETFNKHFPHIKPIPSKNVKRDFRSYAAGEQPQVVADNNQTPPTWRLTDFGVSQVEKFAKGSPVVPLTGAA